MATKDLGTPELQFKRLAMVQGGDPALAEHPLGVLFARQWITQIEYDAGIDFGATWGKVFNPSMRDNVLGAFVPGAGGEAWTEEQLAEAEEKLRIIWQVLNSRQVYDALVNCVIYRRLDFRRMDKIKLALERLVDIGREQRRAA